MAFLSVGRGFLWGAGDRDRTGDVQAWEAAVEGQRPRALFPTSAAAGAIPMGFGHRALLRDAEGGVGLAAAIPRSGSRDSGDHRLDGAVPREAGASGARIPHAQGVPGALSRLNCPIAGGTPRHSRHVRNRGLQVGRAQTALGSIPAAPARAIRPALGQESAFAARRTAGLRGAVLPVRATGRLEPDTRRSSLPPSARTADVSV